MLYPTHKRFGTLFGLLLIFASFSTGMMVRPELGGALSVVLLTVLDSYIGIKGALFGAEFPDCDSYGGRSADGTVVKGSIPSQKHPIISAIFRFCGVKHRGKFSHDVASQTAFWGAIYLLVSVLVKWLVGSALEGDALLVKLVGFFSIILCWMLAVDIVDLYFDVKLMFKGKKKFKKQQQYMKALMDTQKGHFFRVLVLFVVLLVLGAMNGFVPFKEIITGKFTIGEGVARVSMFAHLIKVYVVFTYAGVLSHLFADMLTNQGVSIFGIPLKPAKVVKAIMGINPILPGLVFSSLGMVFLGVTHTVNLTEFPRFLGAYAGLFVSGILIWKLLGKAVSGNDFKTGTAYEDKWYLLVTVACYVVGGMILAQLIGW